jgi:putative SOS response-associated peptidase YedK
LFHLIVEQKKSLREKTKANFSSSTMCGRSATTLEASRYRQQVNQQLPQRSTRGNNNNTRSSTSRGAGGGGSTRSVTTAAAPTTTCAIQQQDTFGGTDLPWIGESNYRPTYNAGPSSNLPIVHYQKDSLVLHTMKWGLYPSHVKDAKQAKDWSSNLINARSETALQKAMFKKLVEKGQRGVCFVNGFYEWEQNKQKQAYFIHEKDSQKLMCFACLYDIWAPNDSDDSVYTFTVLTTEAKGTDIEFLHERIPIILETPEQIELWLTADAKNQEELRQLVRLWKPLPKEHLGLYKVSNFVNSIANNSPKCLQKLEEYRKKNTLHRFFQPAVKKEESQQSVVKKEEPVDNDNIQQIRVKTESDVANSKKRTFVQMETEETSSDEPVLKKVKQEE